MSVYDAFEHQCTPVLLHLPIRRDALLANPWSKRVNKEGDKLMRLFTLLTIPMPGHYQSRSLRNCLSQRAIAHAHIPQLQAGLRRPLHDYAWTLRAYRERAIEGAIDVTGEAELSYPEYPLLSQEVQTTQAINTLLMAGPVTVQE